MIPSPDLLPGLGEERRFQLGQPALRGARPGTAPAGCSRASGRACASVGMPRSISQIRSAFPYRRSIWRRKSRSVRLSVVLPGEDLVGQREALGRDDQRDDHLHAVGPLVPAVAEAALVGRVVGRVALEVGAGQIVEQDLVGAVEEVPPAGGEVGEERALVRRAAGPGSGRACGSPPAPRPAPSRSGSALRANQSRWSRHSLPGSRSR